MYSTGVTPHADARAPSGIESRGMNPIVKVALAAITLVSGLVVMTAFPPAILLVGGLVMTGLFLSCLGSSQSTRYRRVHDPERFIPDRAVVRTTTSSYISPAAVDTRPGSLSSEYTNVSSSVFGRGDFSNPPTAPVGYGFSASLNPPSNVSLTSNPYGALGSAYTSPSPNSGFGGGYSASRSHSGPPSGTGGAYHPGGKSGGSLGSDYTRVD